MSRIICLILVFVGGCAFCKLKTEDIELIYFRIGNQEIEAVAWDDGSVLLEKQKADNTAAMEALTKEIGILTTVMKGM